ncbi:MAG: two-component system, OmpR family, response regulator [Myxococcales bacterium]|nr:two-component system, OmpR family, response regulator [Myxococcales bacterium]
MRITLASRETELCARLRSAFARAGSAMRVIDRLEIWSQPVLDDAMLLHAGTTGSAVRWCRVVRRARHVGPLIALCETIDPAGVAAVLDAGADDVVSASVAVDELLARLRAICRRNRVRSLGQCRVGPILVDSANGEAVISGIPLTLRRTEFRLLSYLVSNADRVVGAHELMRDVLGSVNTANTALIRVHLSQLRRKLGAAGNAIETIRGQGYRLATDQGEGDRQSA